MPAKKTYSIPALTSATEGFIKRQMDKARTETDSDSQRIYRLQAQGAYLLWHNLSIGWVSEDIDARLDKMLEMDPAPLAAATK
jgi:hypothetical protein